MIFLKILNNFEKCPRLVKHSCFVFEKEIVFKFSEIKKCSHLQILFRVEVFKNCPKIYKCSSFQILFTNCKNVCKFYKFVWEFEKMFPLQNLFRNFKKCSYLQVLFGVSENVPFPFFFLLILRNVRFLHFFSGLPSNVHVPKLFVFPNFALEI